MKLIAVLIVERNVKRGCSQRLVSPGNHGNMDIPVLINFFGVIWDKSFDYRESKS